MQSLPDKEYYTGLDALRGIAVLSVVLFHVFPDVAFFSWGWMGVDLFFVISGFLITSILLRADKRQKGFFKHFYARRFLRIVPLCFTVLAVFFLGIALFDKEHRFDYYQDNWWWYLLFLENWLFIVKGFPHEYYLNHFWSLAVEEQFYLLFPFIVYYTSPGWLIRWIPFAVLVVISLRIFIWYFYPHYLQAYYCNTFTRMDTILFGCLLGCGYRMQNRWLTGSLFVLSAGGLVAGILFFKTASLTNPALATVGYTFIAFICYLFLAFFTQTEHTFLFLRHNVLLNYIGKISYGVYLLHLPVYLVVTSVSVKLLGARSTPLLIGVASLVLTLIFSAISYHTLEQFFLRQKRYFPVPLAKQKPELAWQKPVEDNIS